MQLANDIPQSSHHHWFYHLWTISTNQQAAGLYFGMPIHPHLGQTVLVVPFLLKGVFRKETSACTVIKTIRHTHMQVQIVSVLYNHTKLEVQLSAPAIVITITYIVYKCLSYSLFSCNSSMFSKSPAAYANIAASYFSIWSFRLLYSVYACSTASRRGPAPFS